MMRNVSLTLRLVSILAILGILGLTSCSPGPETELVEPDQPVAESAAEAGDSDVPETASDVAATVAAESATSAEDAMPALEKSAVGTDLELPQVEDSPTDEALALQPTAEAQADLAESTPEAADGDVPETASDVAATVAAESATSAEDAMPASEESAVGTDLELSQVEDSFTGEALATQPTSEEVAREASETASGVPPTQAAESATRAEDAMPASEESAAGTDLELSQVEDRPTGEASAAMPTAEEVAREAFETASGVPPTEAAESATSAEDAMPASEEVAVGTDLELPQVEDRPTGEALAAMPTAEAPANLAESTTEAVDREASAYWKPAKPEQSVQSFATSSAFEGSFAACCNGVSVRVTISDADGDTASGRFTSGTSGTSNCRVVVLEDSILLVFDDLSEMRLTIITPDALMLPDAPCVLHRE